ncbi:polysaccharide pyruvyl transferase family protein [Glycomyces sp. NPDC048151]|uniref:polysaccharide pyruvyl transferase family protein n=1 Tax=Glycomyces sp. NPDC048151 TaxID=3364002 RepID=UPI00371181E2
MTNVDMWWWRPRDGRTTNFGDELGPAIVERLGHTVRRVEPERAELVACGSILHMVTNTDTIVWGSGAMRTAPGRRRTRPVEYRRVAAVRGRTTAAHLGLPDTVPLGDPGLLVSALWDKPTTRHRLGVVPHYIDTRTWPDADLVIDVTAPVDEVIAQIGSCAVIAASSLHGLIVADAFGIPSIRLHHQRIGGGDTKYLDYASALDRPLDQIQTTLAEALPL